MPTGQRYRQQEDTRYGDIRNAPHNDLTPAARDDIDPLDRVWKIRLAADSPRRYCSRRLPYAW